MVKRKWLQLRIFNNGNVMVVDETGSVILKASDYFYSFLADGIVEGLFEAEKKRKLSSSEKQRG